MSFVLLFDIPEGEAVEKVRINRELHRANAQMVQNSVWRHESLKKLVKLGMRIQKIGGKASIMEERIVF